MVVNNKLKIISFNLPSGEGLPKMSLGKEKESIPQGCRGMLRESDWRRWGYASSGRKQLIGHATACSYHAIEEFTRNTHISNNLILPFARIMAPENFCVKVFLKVSPLLVADILLINMEFPSLQ